MNPLSAGHEPSAAAILDEIWDAFAGVDRVGGVSWSESTVIDNYGSEEERKAARAADKDRTWLQVADDPTWDINCGIGGFSFLNPIGFRYYLAAAFTCAARGEFVDLLAYRLTLKDGELREWRLSQWSMLSHSQRLCIRHFIEHMIAAETAKEAPDLDAIEDWRAALDSYWSSIPDQEPIPPKTPKHRKAHKT